MQAGNSTLALRHLAVQASLVLALDLGDVRVASGCARLQDGREADRERVLHEVRGHDVRQWPAGDRWLLL